MSDTAQLIKEKIDILDFLRQYLNLKPAGRNYKALCPFHQEKTPSFIVSPDRQSWHCFGCSQGGDVIKFLMQYENLEFYEALKILAEKAGIDLKVFGNRDFKSYQTFYAITEAAKEFFKGQLGQSDFAVDYLKERGLKEETIKEFELGLAPNGSDVLTRHLLRLSYKIDDIEKAGLAMKTERGTYWDRFRSRIMFPIHNHFGKTAAFTGRILPGKESPEIGKYVNSPETPIFQKSKIIYGFYKTKNDIRQANAAVIVEGQMDFLMAWQDGVKNAAAISGTALTGEHLKVLRRIANELVLSFDLDAAGQAAAERAIDLAGANDFFVRLLIIEDEKLKDPADVVKCQPGLMLELVKNSKSAMQYYFYKYLRNLPADQRLKKQATRIVLSKIKTLASAIDRSHWLKELASSVNINEKFLLEEMEALPSAPAVVPLSEAMAGKSAGNGVGLRQGASPKNDSLRRRDYIVQRLLGILLYRNEIPRAEQHLVYFPEKYAQICRSLLAHSQASMPGDLTELMEEISFRASFENQNLDEEKLEKEAVLLFRELKLEYLREKQQEIGELIRKFEEGGDEVKLQAAVRDFDNISKELFNNGN